MPKATRGMRHWAARPAKEKGPARLGTKEKNFVKKEEEHLYCSVFYANQDQIIRNQQKAGLFWDSIAKHHDEYKLAGYRPSRSLESKWIWSNMMCQGLLISMYKLWNWTKVNLV